MRRASIRRGPGTGDEQAPTDSASKTPEPTANSNEAAPMEEKTAAAKDADAPAAETQGDKEKNAPAEKGEGGEAEAPAEGAGEGEVEGEAKDKDAEGAGEAKADGEGTEETKKKKKSKDKKEDKEGEVKVKKVKKSIPAWATLPSVKRTGTKTVMQHPKVHDILIEAIQSSKERTGASAFVILKYIMDKYAFLELDKRKFLLRQSMKRLVEKGAIKQLKGKGFAGSFAIGNLSAVSNSGNKKPAVVVAPGVKGETLGDCLPLIMTRLCEPKEASYLLIKKYLTEHYPQMDVEKRPDILKNALQKAVERGQLEQITGKGATGTFQLKKTGEKPATVLEDAIVTAIIAMNEPKSCSINTLRKFLLESHKDRKEYHLMNQLKRTLEKGKTMGWIEQITGHGLSGSYQLSYPYYPSPAILFPEKIAKQKKKEEEKAKRKRMAESEDEESEEESEEEESEDDEPPPKRRQQKRPAPKARSSASQQRGKSTSRRSAPAKRSVPAKRSAPPAKKKAPPPAKKAVAKKVAPPAKATPVKKAAPARTPKTPVAKKLTSRVAKRPPGKKTPAKAAKADETDKAKAGKSAEPAKAKRAKEQPAKAKPAPRKSSRVKK